jgi:hypothetical protein
VYQRDLPVRRWRHGARVHDRGDGLDAVHEAGTGADHEGVGVDGPHRDAGQRGRHGRSLGDRARQVVAARGDDGQVGLGGGDLRPGQRLGSAARPGRDRLAARRGHQVGDPVPGRERRIHPLDDRDPRAGTARDPRRHVGQPPAEARDQPLGAVGRPGPFADREDRVQHVLERVWVERQHVGAAPQVVQRLRHVPRGQRAHPAQVLRQDEVRAQPGERVGVQRVQVLAAGKLVPDVPVDVCRSHAGRIPAAYHDLFFCAGGGRLVTLERDPDEIIAQAERVHDLGRRRQQ